MLFSSGTIAICSETIYSPSLPVLKIIAFILSHHHSNVNDFFIRLSFHQNEVFFSICCCISLVIWFRSFFFLDKAFLWCHWQIYGVSTELSVINYLEIMTIYYYFWNSKLCYRYQFRLHSLEMWWLTNTRINHNSIFEVVRKSIYRRVIKTKWKGVKPHLDVMLEDVLLM